MAMTTVPSWWERLKGWFHRPAADEKVLTPEDAFEAWYLENKASATLAEVIAHCPMPAWAHALLASTPHSQWPNEPGLEPSLHDIQDGGLMVIVIPEDESRLHELPVGADAEDRPDQWWSAQALSRALELEPFALWQVDGAHRFTVPLVWFVKRDARLLSVVDDSAHALMSACAISPSNAWHTQWRANGHAPFTYKGRKGPRHGWRFGPIELAVLTERWDCVERWGRLDPPSLLRARSALEGMGVRPWIGAGRWGAKNDRGVQESGDEMAAHVDRCWEAIELRKTADSVVGDRTAVRSRVRL